MAYLLRLTFSFYDYAIKEWSDPRTEGWFLMDSVLPVLLIQAAYVYLVKFLGPKWMENRKPMNLDTIMIVYNFSQMIINAYIFSLMARIMLTTFNIYCNPVDYSDDPDSMQLLYATYLYFLTKIVDLLDTVFFVLRKKNKQITFLHVYHHCMMVIFVWVLAKFIGGGHTMTIPFCNTFVHVCMYGYYLLTVWNKEIKNSIWWKKHLTELQLCQFFIGFFVLLGPVITKDCKYPAFLGALSLPQNIFFLGLFGEFYIKNYIIGKKPEKQGVKESPKVPEKEAVDNSKKKDEVEEVIEEETADNTPQMPILCNNSLFWASNR